MKTADQILWERGIALRFRAAGNHKTKCPKCSASRKKKNAPCLSVSIDGEGVRWHCHNNGCDFKGGEFYDRDVERGAYQVARGAPPRSGDREQIRALHGPAKPRGARPRYPVPPQR